MQLPAQRLRNLPENFFARLEDRISALQRLGSDVIRLDIGSPDLPPPPAVIEALSQSAARADSHGYQPHLGPAELRQAWAGMYQRVFGVSLDANSQVLPLLGSKEGIFNLLMAWINPGDVVLVPDPGYMTYTRGTLFAGGQPFYLPLDVDSGFLPDYTSLEREIPGDVLQRARLLWLNYPNNPTGAVASLDFFKAAVAFARGHNLLLCHDAAYTQVCFDGYRAPSLLEVPGAVDVAVEFNSLSKSHNMPGWRLGVAVGNTQVLKALFRIKTNVDSGHFLPVLEAAVAAMCGDQAWLLERNQIYQERRDVVVDALRRLGLAVFEPQAAIYVWSATPAGWSAMDFAASVLEQVHVSLTPGTVFGAAGEGFVRLAITTPTPKLIEAMQRLTTWRE
jgi:LL-diaminopimelate aminotransferase